MVRRCFPLSIVLILLAFFLIYRFSGQMSTTHLQKLDNLVNWSCKTNNGSIAKESCYFTRPQPEEIVFVLGSDGHSSHGELDFNLKDVLANRAEYASIRGYHSFYYDTSHVDPEISPVWRKMETLRQAFKTYPNAKWFWWLDQDALLMDYSYKVEDKILNGPALHQLLLKNEPLKQGIYHGDPVLKTPNTYSIKDVNDMLIIVSQDQNIVNAGSMIFKRDPIIDILIDIWDSKLIIEGTEKLGHNEQDVLFNFMRYSPALSRRIGLVPQRTINGYSYRGADFGWSRGELVIHFAGCWVGHQCKEKWDSFYKEMKELNWHYKISSGQYVA